MSINDPLIGSKLGDYVIQELLGRGGMARVYRGYDENLDRYAAVKVIEPNLVAGEDEEEYRERFLREARAIARLNHPRVVGVFQFAQRDNLYYMAMVYIDGKDLREILKEHVRNGTTMSHDRVLSVIRDTAEALDYAHEQGVIHRDVKPSNIMVMSDGRTVLTDFGLAMRAQEGTIGNTFGSVHYIAPEQAVSSSQASPQSDLYSLGVVLYEMLTGRVPFEEASAMSVALRHISDPPPRPSLLNPDITAQVEEVIYKALNKDPQRRFQTGVALVDALEDALLNEDEEDTQELNSGTEPWDGQDDLWDDDALPETGEEPDALAAEIQESRKSRPSRPTRGSSLRKRPKEQQAAAAEEQVEEVAKQASGKQRRGRSGLYIILLLLIALVGGGAFIATGGLERAEDMLPQVPLMSSTTAEVTPESGGETGPTSTAREAATPGNATPPADAELVTEPRVLLHYDWRGLVIYNRSPDTERIDVRRLSFYDPDTQAVFDQSIWQYPNPRWRMRPQVDCFQVLDFRFDDPIETDFCRFLQAFQPIDEPFWSSTDESGTFEIRWDGTPIIKCRTVREESDQTRRCLVDIPIDDE